MKKLILFICLAFCLIESKAQVLTLSQDLTINSDTTGLRTIWYGKDKQIDMFRIDSKDSGGNKSSFFVQQGYITMFSETSTHQYFQIDFIAGEGILIHGLGSTCLGKQSGTLYKDSNNFLKICP